MVQFEVRPATAEDAPAVRRVARASWHAAYDDVIGADAVDSAIDEWYDPENLAESMGRDDGVFLVACVDEVIGFAQGVLGDEGDPARLARIYVAPDRWGEGVGSQLLDRVESRLRREDADRLRLAVMADNEVGNGFYEERGYAVVAQRDEELFGAAFGEYVREKEL